MTGKEHDYKYSGIVDTEKNQVLALFDFDGTITSKDTLLEFIVYVKGRPLFYIGMFLLMPFLILYKLKVIHGESAKEKVLSFFFKNTEQRKFQDRCSAFVRSEE